MDLRNYILSKIKKGTSTREEEDLFDKLSGVPSAEIIGVKGAKYSNKFKPINRYNGVQFQSDGTYKIDDIYYKNYKQKLRKERPELSESALNDYVNHRIATDRNKIQTSQASLSRLYNNFKESALGLGLPLSVVNHIYANAAEGANTITDFQSNLSKSLGMKAGTNGSTILPGVYNNKVHLSKGNPVSTLEYDPRSERAVLSYRSDSEYKPNDPFGLLSTPLTPNKDNVGGLPISKYVKGSPSSSALINHQLNLDNSKVDDFLGISDKYKIPGAVSVNNTESRLAGMGEKGLNLAMSRFLYDNYTAKGKEVPANFYDNWNYKVDDVDITEALNPNNAAGLKLPYSKIEKDAGSLIKFPFFRGNETDDISSFVTDQLSKMEDKDVYKSIYSMLNSSNKDYKSKIFDRLSTKLLSPSNYVGKANYFDRLSSQVLNELNMANDLSNNTLHTSLRNGLDRINGGLGGLSVLSDGVTNAIRMNRPKGTLGIKDFFNNKGDHNYFSGNYAAIDGVNIGKRISYTKPNPDMMATAAHEVAHGGSNIKFLNHLKSDDNVLQYLKDVNYAPVIRDVTTGKLKPLITKEEAETAIRTKDTSAIRNRLDYIKRGRLPGYAGINYNITPVELDSRSAATNYLESVGGYGPLFSPTRAKFPIGRSGSYSIMNYPATVRTPQNAVTTNDINSINYTQLKAARNVEEGLAGEPIYIRQEFHKRYPNKDFNNAFPLTMYNIRALNDSYNETIERYRRPKNKTK